MKRLCAAVVVGALAALPAWGQTVGTIARLRGQGESDLVGLGLVFGLPGTGDSGKTLSMAQPLAEVLRNNGNPVADFKDLEKTKTVAVVMVMCKVGRGGAQTDDTLDVTVSAIGNATSLQGGQLFLAPLTGPIPGSPVFAVASGPVEIVDDLTPTSAVVRRGAKIVQDILMRPVEGNQFDLVLDPSVAGWAAATHVATAINDTYFARPDPEAIGELVARPLDDRTVRVTIPTREMSESAAFIGDVLATPITPSLLKLPPKVVCDQKAGTIVITGDVQIGPVAISHRGLMITTTTPAPEPSPADPLTTQSRWAGLATGARPSEASRLEDLLAALKQLDVSEGDQIQILVKIHQAGKLHADLVLE